VIGLQTSSSCHAVTRFASPPSSNSFLFIHASVLLQCKGATSYFLLCNISDDSMRVLQCGCESCLAKVVTSKGGCPICRSPIESIQRVFRAGVDLDTPIPAGKTERTLSAAAAQKAAMERLSGSMRNLRVGASAGAARSRSSSNDAACS